MNIVDLRGKTTGKRRVGDVAVLSLNGWLVADDRDEQFRNRIDALVRGGITKIVADLHGVTRSSAIGYLSRVTLPPSRLPCEAMRMPLPDNLSRSRNKNSVQMLLTALALGRKTGLPPQR